MKLSEEVLHIYQHFLLFRIYNRMDKNILELFIKLFSNQISQSNTPPQNQTAFSNYPREAYSQNFSQNQQTPNFQNSGSNSNLLNSLFGNGNSDNSMLPLLLSMMGKNGGGFSSVMETLNKKSTTDETDDGETCTISDDEILL